LAIKRINGKGKEMGAFEVGYGKSFDLRWKNEDEDKGEANGVRPAVRFAFLNYANLFQIIIYENGATTVRS
jgi:hypothetical protein